MTTVQIKISTYDKVLIAYVAEKIRKTLGEFGKTTSTVGLPNAYKKITVQSSPHVDKKSHVQLEERIHTKIITLKNYKVGDKHLITHIIKGIPGGIKVVITKIEIKGLPLTDDYCCPAQ